MIPHSSENDDTLASLAIASCLKKNHQSPTTLINVANCANLQPDETYLVEIETPRKNIITAFPGFLHSYQIALYGQKVEYLASYLAQSSYAEKAYFFMLKF